MIEGTICRFVHLRRVQDRHLALGNVPRNSPATGARAAFFQSLDASFEAGPHSFQLLLQLLILCFELLDPVRKLAQLSLHSFQPTWM
jgi:hypothetical protein